MKSEVPLYVANIVDVLTKAGFEAYLVGGCVRDVLLKRVPKDWDIATNALPKDVQALFPDSVYENDFGTVGVKIDVTYSSSRTSNLAPQISSIIVEVTTYRAEGKYTDKRHPDEVRFAKTIEEDLSRRDFTINAIAMNLATGEMIDPFDGASDLGARLVRTVRDPNERFEEDALRLLRAARFATTLDDFSASTEGRSSSGGKGGPTSGWEIEMNTRRAIEKHSGLLEMMAKERIRDEFVKILMSSRAAKGIILLEELNLLQYVCPEIREGLGVTQNKHHIYTVFEHNVRSLDYAAKEGTSLVVRLASLLHDVGKPRVKVGEGPDSTFYNHDSVGAKMVVKLMDRLCMPKDITLQVAHLVRYHMFYYNVGEISPAGVRRFVSRVGSEYIEDLLKLREADRIGSGVPKAVPYKTRHLLFMIDKVKHDPVSPKMLAIDGLDVMRIADIKPSPKVGQMLNALLEDVFDDPAHNTREYLEVRAKELAGLTEKELQALAVKAKEKAAEIETGLEEEMKKKHHVS